MLISKSRNNSATVPPCQSCSTKKAVAKNHLYSQKPSWSLALSRPIIPLRAMDLSKITKAWVFDWTQYPSWSSCQKVTLDSNSLVSVFNFVFLRLSVSDQLVQSFKSKEPGSPKSEVQTGRQAKQTYNDLWPKVNVIQVTLQTNKRLKCSYSLQPKQLLPVPSKLQIQKYPLQKKFSWRLHF